jgi:hypothetical protein
VVVVHTRWTENDIIGRVCDPNHPNHDPVIAKKWQYFNLPAVVDDPGLAQALGLKLEVQTDPEIVAQFGEKPMCSLWEARKPLTLLAEVRRMDPVGYEALYNGNPSPEEGDYFKKDWLIEYDSHELPRMLRVYGASDHALGTKNYNDESVIGRFGVDEEDNIWILPDLFMAKFKDTGDLVEEILRQMRGGDLTAPQPVLWWAEDEHISKSIGPFLRKRMLETKTYCTIDPLTSTSDLMLRARAIQGRMRMGKVRFPRWAPWWVNKARPQVLRFPHATHDDFVSFLSLIGRGMMQEVRAEAPPADNVIRVGSFAWVKQAADRDKRQAELRKAVAGW